MMKSALGFTIYPYDPCVTNKIVDGLQMTICWHIDDLLIDHAKPNTIIHLLNWLARRYVTPDKKFKATHGPRHDYLGMNIDFLDQGLVKFNMTPYITKINDAFPEKIMGVSSTPAADHLFAICQSTEACFLPEEQARAYHHTTA
jgi:hypothetical protein